MKERPILFSGPMVRALLAGTKTQTRRIMKPQPGDHHWQALPGYELKRSEMVTIDGRCAVKFAHSIPQNKAWDDASRWVRCPYGQPGDRLWVREAFRLVKTLPGGADGDTVPPSKILDSTRRFEADGAVSYPDARMRVFGKLRPAMFMPRWASRITLEVTGVRVERLQDISYEDALAEGAADFRAAIAEECAREGSETPDECARRLRWPQRWYAQLWNDINGPASWAANPWVWVVEFKRAP